MTEASVETAERLRYPLAVGDEAVGVRILAVLHVPEPVAATPTPPLPLRQRGLSWAGFVDWHTMIVFPHRRSVEVAP